MNMISRNEIDIDNTIKKICEFLNITRPTLHGETINEIIKELCIAKLCKIVGITGRYNYKSDFFQFFGCVMGEAMCEKLSIKVRIACDALRLVKYERINLINEIKYYLDNETIDEAFLDAFELIDKFKYLIPKLKKV